MTDQLDTQHRILDCTRERERLNELLAKLPTNSVRRFPILRAIGEVNCTISKLEAEKVAR